MLDEPTNDLDLITLNVLEDYLVQFQGSLIIISHDRYFMDRLVDHLFVFEGNAQIKDFPGNYTDWRMSAAFETNVTEEVKKPKSPTTRNQRRGKSFLTKRKGNLKH